ncbi:MAG TPA: bifunctional metallophosphatase/5'-nucleotidase [Sphingomicrobium sp.]|nr:bifunctional metallophosphatase/5'-nucleotidase [Sphingomicrobium sp.]
MKFWSAALFLPLAACATVPPAPTPPPTVPPPPPPVEVQILALNDFHGNLEPPKQTVPVKKADGSEVRVPVGGAAYVAGALNQLRQGHPFTITVAAGDLIGATPLMSSYFLDEPTVMAANMFGLELNAVGNHEFDRGSAELTRMQAGGCTKYTMREPCAVDKQFPGARFQYLAANVLKQDGATLFPGTALKRFGPITIGFIGMTLKETGILVTPSGVAGLTFADEAATANALVPKLMAQGADAVVLLIHQGGFTEGNWADPSCPGLRGDILPILDKLDPSIQLVVSGHTHWAYRCEVPMPGGQGTRLLTSAGRYGAMLTDIRLTFDPASKALIAKQAALTPVQGEAFTNSFGPIPLSDASPVYPADPALAALVAKYREAARPVADRVVAHFDKPVSASRDADKSSRLSEMIADAQLYWTKPKERGGAQIAFMNVSGTRGDLSPRPDGTVTYGQIFSVQPFGNGLVVQTLTGAQLKQLLELQFPEGKDPMILAPSAGFSFAYDLRKPAGQRVSVMMLNGKPIDTARSYRVVTNSFLASGGDGYSVLNQGRDRIDAGVDLDALEAYLKTNPQIPTGGRVKNLNPEPKPAD